MKGPQAIVWDIGGVSLAEVAQKDDVPPEDPAGKYLFQNQYPTRWTTDLSSKVDLHVRNQLQDFI